MSPARSEEFETIMIVKSAVPKVRSSAAIRAPTRRSW